MTNLKKIFYTFWSLVPAQFRSTGIWVLMFLMVPLALAVSDCEAARPGVSHTFDHARKPTKPSIKMASQKRAGEREMKFNQKVEMVHEDLHLDVADLNGANPLSQPGYAVKRGAVLNPAGRLVANRSSSSNHEEANHRASRLEQQGISNADSGTIYGMAPNKWVTAYAVSREPIKTNDGKTVYVKKYEDAAFPADPKNWDNRIREIPINPGLTSPLNGYKSSNPQAASTSGKAWLMKFWNSLKE